MPAAVILFHEGSVLLNNGRPLWNPDVLNRRDVVLRALLPVADEAGGAGVYQVAVLDSLKAFPGIEPVGVRQFLLESGFDSFSVVGRASQLVNWYIMHRYCGACGHQTELVEAANRVSCTACGKEYYPRINPCIIVLITRGDKILLARSSRRGTDFYSCLAGFIEPGESAEQAVRREVFEEVGLQVTNIRYTGSQPWPFPSQLMLGFYADYLDGEINPDPEEIADADWYAVDQLPKVPSPRISIAGQLIETYVESALNNSAR